MQMQIRSIIPGLVMMFGAPAALAQSPCKVALLAELPVTMDRGRPIIGVKLNGVDERLMVDTGAFWSSLSFAKADELKLKLGGLPYGMTIRGVAGDAQAKLAKVETFTLANAPFKNVDFIVTSGPGNVAGLLGENFLSLMDVEYDLPHGMVRLFKVEKCNDKALAYWTAGKPFSTVAMPRAKGLQQAIRISVTVNGKKIRAIIDSGADTILDRQAAIRAGIDMKSSDTVPAGRIHGIGTGSLPTWVATLDSFTIGDQEEVKNASVRIAELSGDQDMILGSDFLISHRLFVSNSQDKAYLTYEGGAVFNATPKWMVKDADGGLQASVKAAEDDPTDADGLARRGAIRLNERKIDLALEDYNKAVTLAPDNAGYLHQRARIYLIQRRTALAMSDLDHAIMLNAGFVDALADRARLKLQLADRPGALVDAGAASQAAPKQHDVHLMLGSLFDQAGKPDQGVAETTMWINAHPDDARLATAYNNRCWERARANVELDEALKDCNRALQMAKNNPSYLDSRGLAQVRRGAFKEALSDYNAALAAQPKSAWSLFGRSLAYRGLGRTAEADADRAAAIAVQKNIAEEAAMLGLGK